MKLNETILSRSLRLTRSGSVVLGLGLLSRLELALRDVQRARQLCPMERILGAQYLEIEKVRLGERMQVRIPDRPLMVLVGAMIMLISLRTLLQTFN